jgi:hypothetical protein
MPWLLELHIAVHMLAAHMRLSLGLRIAAHMLAAHMRWSLELRMRWSLELRMPSEVLELRMPSEVHIEEWQPWSMMGRAKK